MKDHLPLLLSRDQLLSLADQNLSSMSRLRTAVKQEHLAQFDASKNVKTRCIILYVIFHLLLVPFWLMRWMLELGIRPGEGDASFVRVFRWQLRDTFGIDYRVLFFLGE